MSIERWADPPGSTWGWLWSPARGPVPLRVGGFAPAFVAVMAAFALVIGSLSPWVIDNTADVEPVEFTSPLRAVLIIAAFGMIAVGAGLALPGPGQALCAVLLGLGSLGAILGCLAFIAIGQVGYIDERPTPVEVRYDPNVGIAVIMLASFLAGGIAVYVLGRWAHIQWSRISTHLLRMEQRGL